jgi:hypothetical protein
LFRRVLTYDCKRLAQVVLNRYVIHSASALLRCYQLPPALFSISMVDIHTHILSGLDDGAESLDMSIAMAEMAIKDGITHIIGTPHAHPNHDFIPELVRARRDEIQSHFEGRLTIATG